MLVCLLCYFNASVDISYTDLLVHSLSLSQKPPNLRCDFSFEVKRISDISRLCLFEYIYPNNSKERDINLNLNFKFYQFSQENFCKESCGSLSNRQLRVFILFYFFSLTDHSNSRDPFLIFMGQIFTCHKFYLC